VLIPVLGHVPDIYVAASLSLSFLAGVVGLVTWGTHRVLDALRDVRRFRRGQ